MKCRYCWSDKAYPRKVSGWKGILLSCALLVPLRCHHCYERFVVSWFSTIGKQLQPPTLRIAPGTRSAVPTHEMNSPPPASQVRHFQHQRNKAA